MKTIINTLTFYLLFLLPYSLAAQVLKLENSISVTTPETVSIDRFNNIYISDHKGNIIQYDSQGKILQKYSAPKPVKFSLLESWQPLKIFAFSQDLQQVLFLDRFLTPSPIIKLQDLSIGFARTATLSSDNNLWLIDDSDVSLKKIDLNRRNIIIHSPLNLQLGNNALDINFIKEYQNHLFINDKTSGILVFDILGNYLKTLPIKNLKYFNFLNDELYYLEENQVKFINIYNLQERTTGILPGSYLYILALKGKLILIDKNKMEIFNF